MNHSDEANRSDEGLTLKTSAFKSLYYGGQFTLSTQLIKPNYLVIQCTSNQHSTTVSLETDPSIHLLFMRGGHNQRLQSLLNLNLITAHNAHEKQHCKYIRDKWTCWYGSCLRTITMRVGKGFFREPWMPIFNCRESWKNEIIFRDPWTKALSWFVK